MPEPLSDEKLSDLFSLRRYSIIHRDEADDVTEYRKWQARIDRIDSKLKDIGVMQ